MIWALKILLIQLKLLNQERNKLQLLEKIRKPGGGGLNWLFWLKKVKNSFFWGGIAVIS
jgi:hypothetical protein